MPDFFPPAGTEVVCLCDGRAARAIAEFLLGKARSADVFRLCAYSFDNPGVADELVYAVYQAATATVTTNKAEVFGKTNSLHGKEVATEMIRQCNDAPGIGHLLVLAQDGCDQVPVYGKYNRRLGTYRETAGAMHAKVMYAPPFLVLGSANWSVAAEANHEMACLLRIQGAAVPVAQRYLDEMEKGGRPVGLEDLQGGPRNQARASRSTSQKH